VIAGVDVSVVFQYQRSSACPVENAERGRMAHPVCERIIEDLNKNPSNIILHPAVKNPIEKRAESLRGYTPFCHQLRMFPAFICGPFFWINRDSALLFQDMK